MSIPDFSTVSAQRACNRKLGGRGRENPTISFQYKSVSQRGRGEDRQRKIRDSEFILPPSSSCQGVKLRATEKGTRKKRRIA